jgi:PAS domain S-box-containing protein
MLDWGSIAAGGIAAVVLAALRARLSRLRGRLAEAEADNARLRADLERLRTSQTFSGIGTWDWQVNTETLHWSDEVYPMFGFAPGEVTPSYALFCSMVHPDDAARVRGGEIITLHSGRQHDQEYRVIWRDGTIRWLRETGDILRDAAGRPVRMIGTVRDITDDKAREQRMLHLAFHDELTGLPNRAYFRARMEDALARARRAGTLVALVFIDLDKFKPINDRHGRAGRTAARRHPCHRLRRPPGWRRIRGDPGEPEQRRRSPGAGGQDFEHHPQPLRAGRHAPGTGCQHGHRPLSRPCRFGRIAGGAGRSRHVPG